MVVGKVVGMVLSVRGEPRKVRGVTFARYTYHEILAKTIASCAIINSMMIGHLAEVGLPIHGADPSSKREDSIVAIQR